MPDPGDIAAFIAARLGEEEADARAAIEAGRQDSTGSWRYDRTRELLGTASEVMDGYMVVADRSAVPMDARVGGHITMQDPAATLARCAALRALVKRIEGVAAYEDQQVGGELLRHVAAIWVGHPDYQKDRNDGRCGR